MNPVRSRWTSSLIPFFMRNDLARIWRCFALHLRYPLQLADVWRDRIKILVCWRVIIPLSAC
jgi:hypothetical protein